MPAAPQPPRGWTDKAAGAIDDSIARLLGAAGAQDADVLLVVPPFASADWPSLGVHILENAVRLAGWRPAVLYANLGFSRVVGPRFYRALCTTKTEDLVGERLFRAAYLDAAGPAAAHATVAVPPSWAELCDGDPPPFAAVQQIAARWTRALAAALAPLPFRYLGLSSVFEQTMSSLALIAAVKRHDPGRCALLGGANADGEMAAGLAAFDGGVDHFFQGEAERSLVRFLADHAGGRPDLPRIVPGEVNGRLDDLPPPDYAAFFRQFEATVHEDVCDGGFDRSELRLPYESSRGCWWGAKHHCTFCGLNANGMTHRIKSPGKVAREITELSRRHDVTRVLMVDNIMPHRYFSTLLPQLARAERKLSLFYEQKANISLDRMAALKASGIDAIQPGIESLSTSLLARMRKGSTARINIDCMRYARGLGIHIVWNLLTDFPGDAVEDYEGMLSVFPALHHLQPPTGVGGLSIDRFSPYHDDPAAFGIRAVDPLPVYAELFPGADLHRIAYHFSGEYDSALRGNPGLLARLEAAVDAWIAAWSGDPQPLFFVFDLGADRHLAIDTRACASDPSRLVGDAEAHLLLHGAGELTPEVTDALDRRQLVELDGRYCAIACAGAESPAWRPLPQAA